MINKIIGTFLSRLLAMVVMFTVVIINTNTFGASGTGTLGLFFLGFTMLQILAHFIGGATIVYLVPRKNNFQIIILSYIWAIFINLIGVFLLQQFKLIPFDFVWELLILSLISSFFFIHIFIMQGKEDIKRYNYYQVAQLLVLISTYAITLLVFKKIEIKAEIAHYIHIFIISYFIPLLVSYRYILKHIGKVSYDGFWALLLEMGKLGFWVQLANLSQLMNYRLSYYFINTFAGVKPLGLFELGTKLSEVVWIFPKSISSVQYAHIANNPDKTYSKQFTLSLFKFVFIFSILAVLILMSIPNRWIEAIFSAEFSQSRNVIFRLAPGIVFLSCLSILAHYFSGYGKYWINTLSSLLGFIFTLVLGLIFIPQAANRGTLSTIECAATINSISYFISFIFTFVIFSVHTKSHLKDFILSQKDIQIFKNEIVSKLLLIRKKKRE